MLFRVNWLKCVCSYQVLCKITYISPWILILDEANSLSKMMIVMTCMFANIPKSTSCECRSIPYIILTLQEALRNHTPYTHSLSYGETRQIWGIWKLRPAYSPETPNSGQKRWCFVPCDLEIWWMTLENNRAPLLCCFKLCATFHNHQWIQTGVAVQKRPISVKFDDF